MDRLLDTAARGPFYLRQPALAGMFVVAMLYNAEILKHYVVHAFVVMPNHVHLLVTAAVPLPQLTKSLEGIVGFDGEEFLAGGKLRSRGQARAGIPEDSELY